MAEVSNRENGNQEVFLRHRLKTGTLFMSTILYQPKWVTRTAQSHNGKGRWCKYSEANNCTYHVINLSQVLPMCQVLFSILYNLIYLIFSNAHNIMLCALHLFILVQEPRISYTLANLEPSYSCFHTRRQCHLLQ